MKHVITTARARALSLCGRLGWLPSLAMRVALGVTFIRTGWGKLHDLAGLTAYFESLGIPAASLQAPMVATVELVGGALVLAGLGTRVAALLLTGVMAVALYTAIWPGADGIPALLGSLELIYLVTFLHLAVHGAGAVSLDQLAVRRLARARTHDLTSTTQGALA